MCGLLRLPEDELVTLPFNDNEDHTLVNIPLCHICSYIVESITDGIISDLLDYSREINLQLEEYSSKSLISNVFLSVTIPKNIKVADKTEDYLIRVDANKIQRVFVNLIENAFDAMPNGGELEISANQDEGSVNFIFADTGTGMSKEVSEKIFTLLFTTKAQGMGLGLAICKRFVEAHRGKISVESKQNIGSAFVVSLPIAQKI